MATVLIVEDDPDTLEGLAKLLEVNGYNTRRASNGWEALLALDKVDVDLIVCDLNMPGMTGQTFLKILHNDRRRKDLPAIVLTAMEYEDPVEKAHELGADGWFVKAKYQDQALLRAIQRRLGATPVDAIGDGDADRSALQ
jgi:two-component system OmpR family response regulator